MICNDTSDLQTSLRAKGFLVTATTADEFKVLARSLGEPVPVRPSGALMDCLRPVSAADAPARSLSALHGLGTFPFHTDAAHHRVPPRYLLLRLADGATSETPTLLVDSDPSYLSRSDAATLSRETWLIQGGFGRTFYSPVLDRSRMLLRFDLGCMRQPAGTRLRAPEILERLLGNSQVVEVAWQPRTTLVLDNWRVLHGRPAVDASDTGRVLMRQLLA